MKDLKKIKPNRILRRKILNFIKNINVDSFDNFCKLYNIKIRNYRKKDDFLGSYSHGVLTIKKDLDKIEKIITLAHELSHFIQGLLYGDDNYVCALLDYGFEGALKHEREACYISHILLRKFNPEIITDSNLESIYVYDTEHGINVLKEYLSCF